MDSFGELFKKSTPFLENEYVVGALTLFVVSYAGMLAPNLPDYIEKLFENMFVRIAMFFLFIYVQKRNFRVALISSVALVLSIAVLNRLNLEKMTSLNDAFKSHTFKDCKCNCTCDNLNVLAKKLKSEDAQAVAEETKHALLNGQIRAEEAEMIVKKMITSEANGDSIIVAMTESGAQRMESVANAVREGNINENEGKKIAAQLVIQENVMHSRIDGENVELDEAQLPEEISQEEKHAIAQEVIARKQLVENNNGGPMTQGDVQNLCSQVLREYRELVTDSIMDVMGNDLDEFNYAPIEN